MGVGGAIVTPGFEKIAEFAKKFGIEGAVVVAALVAIGPDVAASGIGLTGVGLGGTSDIDGASGNKGAVGAAAVAPGAFRATESAWAGPVTGVTAFEGSPNENAGATEGLPEGVGLDFVNENGNAGIGGSFALLESCETGVFCITDRGPDELSWLPTTRNDEQ